MAFLKRKTVSGGTYLYVVRSVRDGQRVREQVLRYLGPEREVSDDDAALAVRYWNRWPEVSKGRRAR